MTPQAFYDSCVVPGLRWVEGLINIPVTDRALVLMMAIAGQESNWADRRQVGMPYHPQTIGARGWWQFEGLGGATGEVMVKTPRMLAAVCVDLVIPFNGLDLYEAVAWNDALACAMARLLLWQDPAALPLVGDIDTAYAYYLRNWRPGAPDRARWNRVYPLSASIVNGSKIQ